MVGKSILLEALEDKRIEQILLINRRSVAIQHPKLKEVLLSDFMQIDSIKNDLQDYEAMYHCMGVSAVGLSEEKYTYFTYEITKKIVDTLYSINPKMVFSYVSGTGTDSTEKGRTMWARVKGKTENYIMKKGFKATYMIRLGALIPEKGIKSSTSWYGYLYAVMKPFFPLLKMSKNVITSTHLGKAMLNILFIPQEKKYLDNKDLNLISKK